MAGRVEVERRVPTTLVIVIAASMLVVGAVALVSDCFGEEAQEGSAAEDAAATRIDARTPEAAAESFLDAWRKRDHQAALSIAIGKARQAVLAREQADQEMGDEGAEIKEKAWDPVAQNRLELSMDESETRPDGRLVLRATAEGTFLDRPYRRRVSFVMRHVGERWMVEEMGLEEILSDMPDFLELGPGSGRDPSEFEMRGEDVP